MKKKLLATALSSMFVVGSLAACGDMEGNEIENEPVNDPAVDNTDNGMGNNEMGNDEDM